MSPYTEDEKKKAVEDLDESIVEACLSIRWVKL